LLFLSLRQLLTLLLLHEVLKRLLCRGRGRTEGKHVEVEARREAGKWHAATCDP